MEGPAVPTILAQENEDHPNQPLAPGLYLVGTPIGNLGDITLRAIRVLRSADRIACEDTRQTQKLLNHFGISTPTVSCHEHNEAGRIPEFLAAMQKGARIAVVSDAGMPGISDPGMRLAAAAIQAGIDIHPIPGANAALSALVASGLNTERFAYIGFLPAKAGARRAELEQLVSITEAGTTLVFYEAPHRILETLADVQTVWGRECRIVVARELTKLHEEFLRGSVVEVMSELNQRDRIRGEITLLVEARSPSEDKASSGSITERIAELQQTESLDEKDALKHIARERGLSKSDVYRELQRERAKMR
ncbi:16S rRNA (cytidine(1402)-2'-O)-methyltransferase [Alloacidobacterium sp.]|uniref:16S rRNA (cytidine(1402)-2'-O)-methyltransferase n=1 Tax=Alloacidobacterium sp. TaxID=2951999 RepID=UPI002D74B701|nr:16S rRNA (cytidine(1402)-2'-O)-methyltransferase [Alloacidobacterium sp.]HYK37003.1 16S rRNA (cytidine(1402)-2'-O)-methyltransferase [Alloacidobacterium sp.]